MPAKIFREGYEMAKILDFNALERPTLEITMKDDDRTKIRVTTPTERLYERLLVASAELAHVKDAAAIRATYDLAAELISCNLDGLTVTADELKDKYRLTWDTDLIVFFSAYLDFIHEIKNAKN